MANESAQESLQLIPLTLERLECHLEKDEFWNYYADQRIAHGHRERAFQEIQSELCYPEKVRTADSVRLPVIFVRLKSRETSFR
jgi:hypothetical protein